VRNFNIPSSHCNILNLHVIILIFAEGLMLHTVARLRVIVVQKLCIYVKFIFTLNLKTVYTNVVRIEFTVCLL
jgi:hypothetical protein